jgi:hypothetical protein
MGCVGRLMTGVGCLLWMQDFCFGVCREVDDRSRVSAVHCVSCAAASAMCVSCC